MERARCRWNTTSVLSEEFLTPRSQLCRGDALEGETHILDRILTVFQWQLGAFDVEDNSKIRPDFCAAYPEVILHRKGILDLDGRRDTTKKSCRVIYLDIEEMIGHGYILS
jgi:hypothetical protein